MKRIYSLICGIAISFIIGFVIGNLLEIPYSFLWMLLLTVYLAPFWFLLVHLVSNKRYKDLEDRRNIEICIFVLIISYFGILTKISYEQGYSTLSILIFSIGFIGGTLVSITRILFFHKMNGNSNDEINQQKSKNQDDDEA